MDRYTRLAPSGTVDTDAASRVVRYVFSDESVGRDGHIVKADAWRTDNFEANPVFLWAHSDDTPPIGRVFGLTTQQRELRGAVKYAESDFADSIYQLVRGGFLSAVSTSWMPIKYDRMPNGNGLIFTDVDLLEISQCPVPALPTALATARSRVNVRPLYDWASRALDTGRLGSLDRPLIEAVCRAAKPSSTRSAMTIEERLRRASALQAQGRTDEDLQRFDRYQRLRSEFGFTPEQCAHEMGIAPEALRASVARALASNPTGNRRMSAVVPFEARKFSINDKTNLRQVARHLAKAARHHSALEDHHSAADAHIATAHAAHRKLTSTLKELGERSARTTSTLAELGYDHHKVSRAMKDMGDALDALTKAHGDADDSAGSAQDCVRQAAARLDGMVGSDTDEAVH